MCLCMYIIYLIYMHTCTYTNKVDIILNFTFGISFDGVKKKKKNKLIALLKYKHSYSQIEKRF